MRRLRAGALAYVAAAVGDEKAFVGPAALAGSAMPRAVGGPSGGEAGGWWVARGEPGAGPPDAHLGHPWPRFART